MILLQTTAASHADVVLRKKGLMRDLELLVATIAGQHYVLLQVLPL